MVDSDFRPLSDLELRLLLRLTDQKFAGRDDVLEQINGLEVRQIDKHGPLGCLEFRVNSTVLLPIKVGPIVEGSYVDDESQADKWSAPRVHFLLHVANGRLSELEIYTDDGSEVARLPRLEEIELFSAHENEANT